MTIAYSLSSRHVLIACRDKCHESLQPNSHCIALYNYFIPLLHFITLLSCTMTRFVSLLVHSFRTLLLEHMSNPENWGRNRDISERLPIQAVGQRQQLWEMRLVKILVTVEETTALYTVGAVIILVINSTQIAMLKNSVTPSCWQTEISLQITFPVLSIGF